MPEIKEISIQWEVWWASTPLNFGVEEYVENYGEDKEGAIKRMKHLRSVEQYAVLVSVKRTVWDD